MFFYKFFKKSSITTLYFCAICCLAPLYGCNESNTPKTKSTLPISLPQKLPEKVNDLAVTSCRIDFCSLSWTSTKNTQSYDIRYATTPITNNEQFESATKSNTDSLIAQETGKKEKFAVTNLLDNTTYYFAIKAKSSDSHYSQISNSTDGLTLLAGVIFEDNFDDHSFWSPNQTLTSFAFWNNEAHIPRGFHSYRVQGSLYDNIGNNTIIIDNSNFRGSSGKAITFWNESASDRSTWASDGLLGLNLTEDYEELYVRFFIKFDPNWQWNTGESPQQKFFRASHWNGSNPFVMFADGAHQPMVIHGLAKWNGGNSDIASTTAYRYTNVYYPEDATPSHNRHKNMYFSGGSYAGNGTDFKSIGMMGDGEWHEWKFYIKINTAEGIPDGVYRFWQNGVLVTEESDLAWQDQGANERLLWNYIMLGGNNFNRYALALEEAEQWYSIDDLVISTKDIPSDYNIILDPYK